MSAPGSPHAFKKIRIIAPLGHRDFRLLWSGLVVSLIGDGIFLVAVAWQAYAVDNHPSALAAVGLAVAAPQVLLLLVGGALSDRLPRRSILLASDVARGAALSLLALQGWAGHIRLWHLCVVGAVIGAGTAFASPAFDSIVPELVTENDLQQANGLDQFLRPVTLRLLGPTIGGFLVAVVGTSAAFAVDAGSFVFSAWCLSRIGALGRPAASSADAPSLWTDLREGFGFVRGEVWLWGSFVAASFTYLLCIGPIEVLLPYVVKNQLHGSATGLGLVLGSGGVGALAAAAIVGQRDHVERPVTFMYVAWSGAALLVAAYGVATNQWQLAVAAFVLNAFEAAGAVVWATLKQRLVPLDLLGRVSSIDWFVSTGLTPVSFALTPLVAALLGVRTTLVAAGTAGALITGAFLFLPGMRNHDRPPAPASAAARSLDER